MRPELLKGSECRELRGEEKFRSLLLQSLGEEVLEGEGFGGDNEGAEE